jgi:dihydroflavonol-4-reductase
MTTLVTGGTGFLGRHLVDQLLDRDDTDVRVLTRSYDRELAERGVEVVEGSLDSESDLERAVDGVDRVYHLAGKVDRRPDHAHEMFELHVDGTRRLLEAADRAGVERVVVASTSGTVGVSESPDQVATEESPTREDLVRDWPYYLSKIYAERVCRDVADERDIEVIVMRPTLLLGPGDERESSIGDVVLFMKRKIPATMSGGISFVDARDAADGFIRAMEDGTAGASYLLGQANLSLADFFERLEAITGISAPKMPLPDGLMVSGAKLLDTASRLVDRDSDIDPVSVEMGQYYWYIDSSKAEAELGWEPRDADETLRDTVRWIEQHHPDFANTNEREAPPEEFVPRETVEFADKMSDD